MFLSIKGATDPGERMKGLKLFASENHLVSGNITLTQFIAKYEQDIVAAHIMDGKAIIHLKDIGTAEFLPVTTKLYQGRAVDQLNTMDTITTGWYDTYRDAHQAAEKLCKRTMGERGTIQVVDKDGYKY